MRSTPRDWPAACALVLLCLAGCTEERQRPPRGGAHPIGWAEQGHEDFHGTSLRESGYPLGDCRTCHGDDYRGGVVSSDCESAGCHTGGVEACDTCHGADSDPLPVDDAHAAHDRFCASCHPIPDTVESGSHLDGTVDLVFSGLAAQGGGSPSWDPEPARCSGTHCHGESSPPWSESGPLACDACHGAPPESHGRFERVAAVEDCLGCHPGSEGPDHVDGLVITAEPACDACHGDGLRGMPAPALDGSTALSAPGVGAHRAHVDSTAPGRIGRAVSCTTCHPVPSSVSAPGHLDTSPPADVVLPIGGDYAPADQSCAVWCHFDADPAPTWTEGAAASDCDACHGMPPERTRVGTAHPPTGSDPSACAPCHSLSVTTHVDGVVDFR